MTITSSLSTVGELRAVARERAEDVRKRYWMEGYFPLDPIAIARRMGIEVYSAQLGNDVFGMLVGTPAGPQMYLDEDQPEKRYRFTAAHELGHYMDRIDDPEAQFSFVDKRSEEGRGTAPEIFANEFAASLLMPAAVFRARIDAGYTQFDLAEHFGVSPAAAGYRRQVLGA